MIEIHQLRLREEQAYALAELCKRFTWEHAVSLAASESEVYAIRAAVSAISAALAEAGVRVR